MSVKFIDNSGEFLNEMVKKKTVILEMIGLTAEKYAKEECPVDTGRLRNSITHEQIDENNEVIGSAVDYAPNVELGTVKQKAHPYLKPAVINHKGEYKSIANDIMGGK